MLAFACAFTMFAGAAFTDQADISKNNADAVELLTALNIIQGDPDGSFAPEREVTRAEMAKMIYVIRNGGNDNADAYKTVSTSFTDISGHWAEGYIKYLQNTGIVAGKSATRFDPDSTVTTGEAMKMALVLAGYRADKAGLTGTQWLNNTVSYATTYGLTKDVNSAIAGGCTRQDAAQILSNTLTEVNAVQWSEVTNSFLNDSEKGLAWGGEPMTVGEKWMDLKIETGFITKVPNAKKNAKGVEFMYDSDNDGTIEDGEAVTFKNVTTDLSDMMGYEVKVVWNDDKTADADAIYGVYKTSNNVTYEVNWKDIEQNNAKVKFGGKSYDLGAVPAEIIAANQEDFLVYADADWNNPYHDWTSASFDKAALADNVTFIDCDGDGKLDAAQIHTEAVTKVTYVGTNNITTNGLVGAQGLYGVDYTNNPKLDDINVYEGVAKDDYAVVSYDVHSDKITYTKAELQTGKVEGTRTVDATKEVKLNGEWMKATAGYALPTSFVTGDTVEYVAVDNLIYHIKKTDGSWGSSSIAMIYKTARGAALDDNKVVASIIKRDGTKLNITVSEVNGTEITNNNKNVVDAILGQPVTFRVVDGEYEFKTLSASNTAGYADYATTNTAYAQGDKNYGGKEISDQAVVFVYDDDNHDADVLTGSELKKATAAFALVGANDPYLYDTENDFTYVFCMAVKADLKNLTTKGGNYAYLLSDAWEDSIDGKDYRVFSMWTEGGELTAYEESGDTYTYEAGDIISYEVSSTKDGTTYIKNVDLATTTAGKVTAQDGNYVGLNGTKYELVNDSVVLNVNTDEKEGISGGTDAREQIAVADTSATGKANVRFIVDDASNEVVFMLIDSANNEIVEGTKVLSPSATLLTNTLADAEAGDTVTIAGNIPTGTFTVKDDVTLKIAEDAIVGNTTFEIQSGASLKTDVATNSSEILVGPKDARIVTADGTKVTVAFNDVDAQLATMTIAGSAEIPAGQTWYSMFGQDASTAKGLDMQVTSGKLTVNGTLKLISGSNGSKLTVSGSGAVEVGANGIINVAGKASIVGNNKITGTAATSQLNVTNGSGTISGVAGVSDHTAKNYTWNTGSNQWK